MREFTITQGGSTVTGTASIIVLNPAGAPNPNIEFLRFWVGQSANATSAQQRIQLSTQVTSFPTVTAYTPVKLKPSDPNASIITGNTTSAAGQCGVNASTDNGGAQSVVWEDAFNVLNGWLHVPTPAETRIMPAGFASCLDLRFPTGPTTLTNWAYGLVFREV